MIIACATDRRFAQLAGVMLASAVADGDIGESRIVVFASDLTARDKRRLRQSCGTSASRVTFIDVGASNPVIARLTQHRPRISPALNFRLVMPDLLTDADDRLLYLDSDIIVNGSLRPLMEIDLDGRIIAAVPDSEEMHPGKAGRFEFPLDAPYFNSGVLLIDLAEWRKKDMTSAILAVIDSRGDSLGWFDQDALNLSLVGQWLPLGAEWNAHDANVGTIGGYDKARIIHYTGRAKPSYAECTHPMRELYLRHRENTPWRGTRLSTRSGRRWEKIIEKRRKRIASLWSRMSARAASPASQGPR